MYNNEVSCNLLLLQKYMHITFHGSLSGS